MTLSPRFLRRAALSWLLLGSAQAFAGVENTKHNLSMGGPGMAKSIGETEVCIFCHAPHSTTPATPQWNRNLPTVVYIPYSSPTMVATPGQPTYGSKLCLSCHDGTIALGSVKSRSNAMTVSGALSSKANLTTDLSDDHPISFVYDSMLAARNGELADPGLLTGPVHLDVHGQLQCTTCHDPHTDTFAKFLVADATNGALCTKCHRKKGWAASAHATSSATWNGAGANPWPRTSWKTVASNSCENCHTPHSAGIPKELLTLPTEEGNCLSCHGGNVAHKNIAIEVAKTYRHSGASSINVHSPVENSTSMPRHVVCQDCHNPHQAIAGTAKAPAVSGPLTGVAGINMAGTRTASAVNQYEICLRCHADAPNVPAPNIVRAILQSNVRLKFQMANPSFHPIFGPRNNTDVVSLILPWTSSSRMYCTDCHNSDSGPGAGGTGPRGPHGSNYRYLLERQYLTADRTTENTQAYALCYKCHDRNSILADRSFSTHRKHIVDQRTPCSVCHDPHGISSTQASAAHNSNLINFDRTIVTPDSKTGRLEYDDLGLHKGQCYLTCHGDQHSPK